MHRIKKTKCVRASYIKAGVNSVLLLNYALLASVIAEHVFFLTLVSLSKRQLLMSPAGHERQHANTHMHFHTHPVYTVPWRDYVHLAALVVRYTTVLLDPEALQCKITAVCYQCACSLSKRSISVQLYCTGIFLCTFPCCVVYFSTLGLIEHTIIKLFA